MSSEAIHGNKSQNARQKALDNFSRGKARVLVATDLASRGIDVTGVTHVINYELPADAESYVHRIGRTARAGASGIALSFCDSSERGQLKSIERLTNQRIAVVPTPANEDMPAAAAAASARRARGARQRASEQPTRVAWSMAVPAVGRGRPGGGGGGGRQSSPVRRSVAAAIAARRPRPSTSGRAATIATSRRAIVRKVIVPRAVLPRATATARVRRPIVPTRRARRATVRSAVRRAATAAAASAAVVRAAVAAVAAGRPSSAIVRTARRG